MIVDRTKIGFVRRRLLRWFRANKRDYPWRRTHDPWKVLIAEMMLQRTKADQVEHVYRNFFREFKKPSHLAKANPATVRKILMPLGLRWRVPKFRLLARELMREFSGGVPRTRRQLLLLPGVGDYIAGAVLSIAFRKKEWIVDANVVRLFKRFFDLKTGNEGRRDKVIIGLSKAYSQCKKPRDANLALLDFASIICKPRRPLCNTCPIRFRCFFFSHNLR